MVKAHEYICICLTDRFNEPCAFLAGALFECAMVDSFGKPSTVVWEKDSYVFSRYGEENGFVFEDDALNDPDFLVGDCFTFSCTVSVLKKPQAVR